MENYEIQSVLMESIPLEKVYVSGDNDHLQIIAVGEMFEGMSRIKKHQIIYEPLISYIADNRIHALSIKTYSLKEWECHRQQTK